MTKYDFSSTRCQSWRLREFRDVSKPLSPEPKRPLTGTSIAGLPVPFHRTIPLPHTFHPRSRGLKPMFEAKYIASLYYGESYE